MLILLLVCFYLYQEDITVLFDKAVLRYSATYRGGITSSDFIDAKETAYQYQLGQFGGDGLLDPASFLPEPGTAQKGLNDVSSKETACPVCLENTSPFHHLRLATCQHTLCGEKEQSFRYVFLKFQIA